MESLTDTEHCTLPTAERPLRLAELDDLFATHVTRVTWDDAGLRLRLSGEEGLRERVLDLTAREARCCSFFTFTVDGTPTDVTLHVTVPAARRGILDALAARAAEMSA